MTPPGRSAQRPAKRSNPAWNSLHRALLSMPGRAWAAPAGENLLPREPALTAVPRGLGTLVSSVTRQAIKGDTCPHHDSAAARRASSRTNLVHT